MVSVLFDSFSRRENCIFMQLCNFSPFFYSTLRFGGNIRVYPGVAFIVLLAQLMLLLNKEKEKKGANKFDLSIGEWIWNARVALAYEMEQFTKITLDSKFFHSVSMKTGNDEICFCNFVTLRLFGKVKVHTLVWYFDTGGVLSSSFVVLLESTFPTFE